MLGLSALFPLRLCVNDRDARESLSTLKKESGRKIRKRLAQRFNFAHLLCQFLCKAGYWCNNQIKKALPLKLLACSDKASEHKAPYKQIEPKP
jgi:hypothetical protein